MATDGQNGTPVAATRNTMVAHVPRLRMQESEACTTAQNSLCSKAWIASAVQLCHQISPIREARA
jgi:hypothetical protein